MEIGRFFFGAPLSPSEKKAEFGQADHDLLERETATMLFRHVLWRGSLWGSDSKACAPQRQHGVVGVYEHLCRTGCAKVLGTSLARSSSREVRVRVPAFFLQSVLVGDPSPKKVDREGHYWGAHLVCQENTSSLQGQPSRRESKDSCKSTAVSKDTSGSGSRLAKR